MVGKRIVALPFHLLKETMMDRKNTYVESGVEEIYNMHCKGQGRGHMQLIHCPTSDGKPCTRNIYDGSQHETTESGPDVDVPKDEFTHETYWTHMRFEDLCIEEDRKKFALCNHLCRSEEHNKIDGCSLVISYKFTSCTGRIHDI